MSGLSLWMGAALVAPEALLGRPAVVCLLLRQQVVAVYSERPCRALTVPQGETRACSRAKAELRTLTVTSLR